MSERQKPPVKNGGKTEERITNLATKKKAIGRIGERIAQRLVGGSLLEPGDKRGDLANEATREAFEVKTWGIHAPVQLGENQLCDRLESATEYTHFYIFIRYLSRRMVGTRQVPTAPKRPTPKELERFLVTHVRQIFVVDTRILEAYRVANGAKWRRARNGGWRKRVSCLTTFRRSSNGGAVHIQIPWRFLEDLLKDPEEALAELGLSADLYAAECERKALTFAGSKAQFELFRVRQVAEAEDTMFDAAALEALPPRPEIESEFDDLPELNLRFPIHAVRPELEPELTDDDIPF